MKKPLNISLWVLGLAQAVAVFAYGTIAISLLTLSANAPHEPSPILVPVVAVLSTLVAGLCTLARPLYLFSTPKSPARRLYW